MPPSGGGGALLAALKANSVLTSALAFFSFRLTFSLPSCRIFAVTVSSQVRGGEQETLCAQIHGATEPVSLTVTLEIESSSNIVLKEDVKLDFYRCLNFQV